MQPLVLLHGAIGAKDQLLPLSQQLRNEFELHSFNFNGHGGEAIRQGAFNIEGFAQDFCLYLQERNLSSVNVFGYSMGGYVAMYVARHYPNLIKRIITLGTKWEWSEAIADKECSMLNPEKIEAKVPAFAQQLRERHAPHDWKEVLGNTAAMLRAMGQQPPLSDEDLTKVKLPVLLLLGDHDKMVSKEETGHVAKLAEGANKLLPNSAHPMEQVDIAKLTEEVRAWML